MLARVPLMAGNNLSIWKLRSCPVATRPISHPSSVNEVAIVEFATMNSPRLVNTSAMSVKASEGGGGRRLDLFDPINSSTRNRIPLPPPDFCDYHDRKCNTLVLIGNFRYRNSRIEYRWSRSRFFHSSRWLGGGLVLRRLFNWGEDVSVQFAISNDNSSVPDVSSV